MTTETIVSRNVTLDFTGIDVSAAELMLVIRKNAIPMKVQKFANTPTDRLRLVKRLSKFPGVTRVPGGQRRVSPRFGPGTG